MGPVSRWLVDFIFPPRCPACLIRTAMIRFCAACARAMPFVVAPICPICGLPFAGTGPDHPCPRCLRARPHFNRARARSAYRADVQHPLMEALRRLKYARDVTLAPLLAEVLAAQRPPSLRYDAIVPVPLHPARMRWRGFNQAVLLARGISPGLSAPVEPLALRRHRATPPQVGLGEVARRRNVRHAFRVAQPAVVHGASVLLVDDVMTTGATVDECARVLKTAGARQVDVMVLLRALDTP